MRTVGNSHSLHILPLLKKLGRECGWEIIHAIHPDYINMPSAFNGQINRIEEVLRPLRPGDLLILSSRYRHLYKTTYLSASGDKWVDWHLKREHIDARLNKWLEELDIILLEAKSKSIQVILFLPNVEFDVPVMKESMCRGEWFQVSPDGCNPSVSKEFLYRRFPERLFSEIERRSLNVANFYVFDPLPVYCQASDFCSRKVNGVLAFKDTNHLSLQGSLLMLDDFNEFLVANKLLE
ncbi:MAG: SGNH hydrolase domain-containing protein [Halioglobus sp.]